MSLSKKIRIAIIIGIVVLGGLYIGERLSIDMADSFVSTAEARVGRPLTPVSVAGVARRTSRRTSRRY
jgi:hypothetical protein